LSSIEVTDDLTKKILAGIYLQSLMLSEPKNVANMLVKTGRTSEFQYLPPKLHREYLARLERNGLISFEQDSGIQLTASGREKIVVVMLGGAFDIIHPGHVETLRQARALGDVLTVSVARNSTYKKNKNKEPVHDEKLRLDLVSSIKFVDLAILGSEKDIFETVFFLKPDIIALGYDQSHTENAIKDGVKKIGLDVKVIRLGTSVPAIKTSSIMNSNDKEKLLAGT
jgi:FAD synthetase